jgi:hypothetical protein
VKQQQGVAADFAQRDFLQGEQRMIPGEGDGDSIPPDDFLAQFLSGFGMHRETRIDLTVVQGLGHFADGHFVDSDFGQRFFLAAMGQQSDKLRLGQMVGKADAQLPAVVVFRGAHAGAGAFHERQQAAGFVPEDLASMSELQASLLVADQVNSPSRFHLMDRSGKGRGFDVNLDRGAGEALFLGNGQEVTQITHSHTMSPCDVVLRPKTKSLRLKAKILQSARNRGI